MSKVQKSKEAILDSFNKEFQSYQDAPNLDVSKEFYVINSEKKSRKILIEVK